MGLIAGRVVGLVVGCVVGCVVDCIVGPDDEGIKLQIGFRQLRTRINTNKPRIAFAFILESPCLFTVR